MDGKDALSFLPREILRSIIFHIVPEEIKSLSVVSKSHYQACHDEFLWKKKLETHFPNHQVDNDKSNFQQFWECYRSEYKSLTSEQSLLFSYAKESKELDELFLVVKNLDLKDRNSRSLLYWVHTGQNAKNLDLLFAKKKLAQSLGFSSIAWAVVCHRPYSEIENLIANDKTLLNDALIAADQFNSLALMNGLLKHVLEENVVKLFKKAAESGAARIVNHISTHFRMGTEDRNSALTSAVSKGHTNVVLELLRDEINSLFKAEVLNREFQIAAANNYLDIVVIFLQMTSNNKPGENAIKNSLYKAAETGNSVAVKFLIASPLMKQSHVNFALNLAVKNEHLSIVKLLILAEEDKRPELGTIEQIKTQSSNKEITLFLTDYLKYYSIIASCKSPLERINALLNHYTKNNSKTARLFSGAWSRNHVEEIIALSQCIQNKHLTHIEVIEKLHAIPSKNPSGELAKIIKFIDSIPQNDESRRTENADPNDPQHAPFSTNFK